jgi:multidrug resistance efflux pump
LHNQLAVEQGRLARRQHVELVLPVRARILRISAQDGELVSRGQEIATAVDCSQPMVTADVSEAVFRKLFVGMPGEFRVSGESTRHAGRIVQMVSPLDDTQGQRPVDAARRRVVLRLEPEGMASSCQVGRMGQVSF